MIRHDVFTGDTASYERETLTEYVYDALGRTAEERPTTYDGYDPVTFNSTPDTQTRVELQHMGRPVWSLLRRPSTSPGRRSR